MIEKDEFMVVITATSAKEFAQDVVKATKLGYKPVSGQWAWNHPGMHTAYMIDVASMPQDVFEEAGDGHVASKGVEGAAAPEYSGGGQKPGDPMTAAGHVEGYA